MKDKYERDNNGRLIMSISNIERLQHEIENETGNRPNTIVPSFKCPNPNNLEEHYVWFSCLLRCKEDPQ